MDQVTKSTDATAGTDTAAAKPAATPKVSPPAPGVRKYTWHGITPSNPRVYNIYGSLKLRPWSMTDEEIDAVIKVRPDLARLWKVAGETKA